MSILNVVSAARTCLFGAVTADGDRRGELDAGWMEGGGLQLYAGPYGRNPVLVLRVSAALRVDDTGVTFQFTEITVPFNTQQ